MKIQFNFADRKVVNDTDYEISFTIVGLTRIDKAELILASQSKYGLDKIRQKITAELVALLQLDLYGKIIESGGDNEKKEIQKVQMQEKHDSPVVVQSSVPATENEETHSEIGSNQKGTK